MLLRNSALHFRQFRRERGGRNLGVWGDAEAHVTIRVRNETYAGPPSQPNLAYTTMDTAATTDIPTSSTTLPHATQAQISEQF